jgi:hypothetical protein
LTGDGGRGPAPAGDEQDDALFLLLSDRQNREHAVTAWERRVRVDPARSDLLHTLAVAYSWWAREQQDNDAEERSCQSWRQALAYWAAVLSDRAYWEQWVTGRARTYQVRTTADHVTGLLDDVARELRDQLRDNLERQAGRGLSAPVRAYQELGDMFDGELLATRLMRQVGGLDLPGERRMACGPHLARHLGLSAEVARLVVPLPDVAAVPDGPVGLAQCLRWAFSEASTAFTFYESARYDRALSRLPDLTDRPFAQLEPDCPEAASGTSGNDHPASCPTCGRYVTHDPPLVPAFPGAAPAADRVGLHVRVNRNWPARPSPTALRTPRPSTMAGRHRSAERPVDDPDHEAGARGQPGVR